MAFPGCGAARSGAPLIRSLHKLGLYCSEYLTIPGLQRTTSPLVLRCAWETFCGGA